MDRLRTALLEHRRSLAALCTALAVLLTVVAVRQPGDVVPVPVAARDLTSGHVVTSSDVTVARLPADATPRAVVAQDDAVGRRVGGPMRTGEPFTDARLLTSSPADSLDDDRVLSTVALADPGAAQGLRTGDRVDVLAVAPQDSGPRATVVASGLRVAATPPADAARDVAALTLETTRPVALQLARAGLEAQLTVVLAGPSAP